MNIAIVNRSQVPSQEFKNVVTACQAQVSKDLKAAWGISANLRLSMGPTVDGVLYVVDDAPQDGTFGFHEETPEGIVDGFVFRAVSEKYGEPWSTTLSHELLEMLLNPQTADYALGQHPTEHRPVFVWKEACDAVQNYRYQRNGVWVSDFVLPAYFSVQAESGKKNDWMGVCPTSLGVAPGGYFGYYDPKTGQDETCFAKGDAKALSRLAARQAVAGLRRGDKFGHRAKHFGG